MSFIAKGIDLPFGDYLQEIKITFSRVGGQDYRSYIFANEALDKIIQIPKGHGDIKDADELINHLRKDPLFDMVERYGVTGVIKSRPTILEAEEE